MTMMRALMPVVQYNGLVELMELRICRGGFDHGEGAGKNVSGYTNFMKKGIFIRQDR
jgi:hypothetical protein